MNIEKLINDLKASVRANIKNGDKCEICRQDDPFEIDDDYCDGCYVADCETFSEKYRSYKICAEWYTHSWLEHAFSDLGADLSPVDYGFEEYYADEISEKKETQLDDAMETFCKQFKKL